MTLSPSLPQGTTSSPYRIGRVRDILEHNRSVVSGIRDPIH